MGLNPRFTDPDTPLVSVVILSFNQGKHLRECFDSVLAQTYDNIEIIVSDNHSTDDSWDIALDYQARYPEAIFLARQRRHYEDGRAFNVAWSNVRGHYFLELNVGDAVLHEDFIQTCVSALQAHPDAGFSIAHASTLSPAGQRIDEPPFYEVSCKIPGRRLAASLLSERIFKSSAQVVFRKAATTTIPVTGGRPSSCLYIHSLRLFLISLDMPGIYINASLVTQRPEYLESLYPKHDPLLKGLEEYLFPMMCVEAADNFDIPDMGKHLPRIMESIAQRTLRLAVRTLLNGNEAASRRFFYQAAAFQPEITMDETFRKLESYWTADEGVQCDLRAQMLEAIQQREQQRSISPPEGSTPISVGALHGMSRSPRGTNVNP